MSPFKAFWRRKWLAVIFLVSCISLLVILVHQSVSSQERIPRDTYMDDVPEDFYQKVLREWYNFTDGEPWFNKDYPSPSSETWGQYLTEIRDRWIIQAHDPNRSYLLENPEISDQSMGQAQVIREIFNDKREGFFVECGAYDGETRSNTLVLERFLDWTGLLIEADPINFSKMLRKNRNAYLSPSCLSVSSRPTLASFLMARNVGRLHEPNNSTEGLENSPDVAHTGTHIRVQCFPFADYLAALGIRTVDYFSLDIEGNEIEVLETIPFDQLDIMTLSVEHVHNAKGKKYLIDLMESKGYYVYSFVERDDNLANDVIFVKRGS